MAMIVNMNTNYELTPTDPAAINTLHTLILVQLNIQHSNTGRGGRRKTNRANTKDKRERDAEWDWKNEKRNEKSEKCRRSSFLSSSSSQSTNCLNHLHSMFHLTSFKRLDAGCLDQKDCELPHLADVEGDFPFPYAVLAP